IINNFNIFKNFKECKSKILSFFTSTLMSIGLDAFFLIPIITSLEGSKGPTNLLENTTFKDEMFSKNHYIFEKMFKFSDFMSKFFTGAFEWRDVMYGLPFVFCGVGMILLCFLYFFNNLISKKKRIATFMFLLIMFISSNFALINNIWHGFNPPTGFPCRYSFMISFLVICAAYENFLNLNLDKNIIKNSILSIIFIASIFYLKKIGFQHFKDFYIYYLIITAIILILLFFKNKIKKISNILIMLLVSLDLGINGYFCLKKYNFTDAYEFDNFINTNGILYNNIQKNDNDFYRIEKKFHRTRNDNMLFGANGVTHYSSSEKDFIKDFVGNLGLEKFGKVYGAYGYGSTISVDSLLGIKYLLSHYKPNKYYTNILDPIIYKNPFCLPISFMVDKSVINLFLDENNKFENQNKIFSCMTSNNTPIFTECKNSILIPENMKYFQSDWGDTVYYIDDSHKTSCLSYFFSVDSDKPLYVNFNSIRAFEANMKINGVEKNFDLANKAIYYLGQYEKGSMLNIKLYPRSKYLYLKNINLYQENVDLLKEYTNYLKQEPCKLEKISSSHLKGKIEVKSKDKYLFFSIPYEKEWKIKIDGKLCNVAPAFDALMSVPIDPGEHIIDMRYIPKGFYLGLWISLLCAFILLSKYFYKILLKKGMKKDGNDINNRALL
ncbi:MAG: YfhO family protein, partial [Clostridia bacterium]|nr:YfhO family protein [Clostridia bacterium]